MVHFGERLKEERLRVGMSQIELANAIGMSQGSQTLYETAKRNPDMAYLIAIQELGLDAAYIVTGAFTRSDIPKDEQHFLAVFRKLDQRGRMCVMGAMLGYLEG